MIKKIFRRRRKRDPNNMTIAEHLRELKSRVFKVVFTFLAVFILCYVKCGDLLDAVLNIGQQVGYVIVYISPSEVLLQQIYVASTFAFFITCPILVYEIVVFITPVFDKKYMKYDLLAYGCFAIAMFCAGVLFAYKVLLPFMYNFLFEIGIDSGIKANISLEKYISAFLTLIKCLGIIFEMPIICLLLTKVGILTPEKMKKFRRIVIVIIFVISAIITPPDIVSQLVVAVPMIGLYQISILICKFVKKER